MLGTDHRHTYIILAVLAPVVFLVAMADGGEGSTPPPEGDWNITEDTVVDGDELIVTGNINVGRGATLIVTDSVIRVNSSCPHQFTMLVADDASLTVVNSSLHLDTFESEPRSSLSFSGDSVVKTRGMCLLRSLTIFADGVTFLNIAPMVDPDEDGEIAICIFDGSVNSEFRNVTIRNEGSSAGVTGPGVNGSTGGKSILISNVSTWIGCTIECIAGDSRGGGLGLHNSSGGIGGHGADVQVSLRTNHLEDVSIEVVASAGGSGARGARNPSGNAGDGGDGNHGGNATLQIECDAVLQLIDLSIHVISGNGGSGGNGGEATDGEGGDGGAAGHAGDALIEIGAEDDIHVEGTTLVAIGGEGGWGGDYGRHEGGVGTFGAPAPGSDGGRGRVMMTGPGDLFVDDLTIEVRGGSGLDGGGGYEQGEGGGDGGDGAIHVVVDGTIEADLVDLKAIGGNGGPGGPAFSDILGNGGDGGDAIIVFTGLEEMDVSHFSIYVIPGIGGEGYKPIYHGDDGIDTLDLETELLEAEEGTFNMPLDDLSGNARGYLYNVTFDMEFGIHVLPIGDAIVWESYPVTVMVVDDPDPGKASPLEGWKVSVYHIGTGALVVEGVTDENGMCYFDLLAFEYTSLSVNYIGSYHFIASSPDRKTARTVRGEIQGHTQIRSIVAPWPPMVHIHIERPEDGVEYTLYPSQGDHLETNGFMVMYDGEMITSVFVQLLPEGADANDWPLIKLGLSPVPYEDLVDKEARWGKYFPPNQFSNKWLFFFRFPMADDDLEYYSGVWEFHVKAHISDDIFTSVVSFDLLVDENLEIPWVQVITDIHGKTFNGSVVVIEGTAGDDYQLLLVEARIDSGEWVSVGTDEDWTHALDTGALGDGSHTIDFRAFDGQYHSNINANSFEVRVEEDQTGNGGGNGGSGWDTQMYLIAGGAVLMVIALALLAAIVIIRRRSPPDS